jgi:ADP-ribose pyrophosphatase
VSKPIHAWKELSREVAFKKYSRKVEAVVFELPDGSTADFYIKAEGPAASILALTPDKKVILVKQYRPGPKEILDELPGGFVDPNEHPKEASQREFREETGYDGDFTFIGTCLDDAYSTMERYCYVAKNCQKVGEPQPTVTEQTEVALLPVSEFRERLRQGKMTDVEVAYLGLDYLGLL